MKWVYAQRFDPWGARRGGEFRVNSYTPGDQAYPSVAADGLGHFVVAWDSQTPEGGRDIFARRYSFDGPPLGPEFRVNTYTPGTQYWPDVAMDWDGFFLVTWTSVGQDGSRNGVFGQRFDPNGIRLGSEFRVNSYTTDSQARPSATLVDGQDRFVVTWASRGHLE